MIKCSVVGDSMVGKTCVIHSFGTQEFIKEESIPTVASKYEHVIEVGEKEVHLQVCDTSGQDEF